MHDGWPRPGFPPNLPVALPFESFTVPAGYCSDPKEMEAVAAKISAALEELS